MSTRWARFVRGWMAACVATFVAAFLHIASGGAVPNPAAIALCLAFSGMACILLAGRRLSRARLTISVALSQLLFHAMFLIGTPGQVRVTAGAMPGMPDMDQPLFETVGHGGAAALHALPADPAMWLGHAIAAAVTVLLLRSGESTFWRLVAFTGFAVAWMLASASAPLAPPSTHRRLTWPQLAPLAPHAVISQLRHRGPPLSFAG